MKDGCGLDEKGLIHGTKSLANLFYLIGSSIMKSDVSSKTYESGLAIFIAGSVVNLLVEMYLFRKIYKAGITFNGEPTARLELYRLITSAGAVLGAFFTLIGVVASGMEVSNSPLLAFGGASYTGSGTANVAKNQTLKLIKIPQYASANQTIQVSSTEDQLYGLSRNPNAIHILESKLNRINWSMLSENPNAVPLLERNLHKIDWRALSSNTSPAAIALLERYKQRIDWKVLSGNKSALSLLTANPTRIDWAALSGNSDPAAISMLQQAPARINWSAFSGNESDAAVALLEQNLSRVDWSVLSGNPKAISLLEKYPRRIDWDMLSMNSAAMALLERYPHKINWSCLSCNPSAIPFLEQKPFKIDWARLSENPNAIHLLEDSMHKIAWGKERSVTRSGSENV